MDFANACSLILIFGPICTCLLNDTEELWRRTQLTSVVSYENMDALFKELHHCKFSVYQVPGELKIRSESVQQLDRMSDNLKIKNEICESIFSSDYFSSRQEKSVNPESWYVYSELRKNQNIIYRDLFKVTGERSLMNSNHEYHNPFQERTVSIFGQSQEVFLFSCLVKRKKKNYKQYFISEEFDLGAPLSRSIAGRFVFGRADNSDELVIHAIAQEPAMSFTQKLKRGVEFFYLDKRLSSGIASQDLDPICKLSPGERLRLCAALFGVKALQDRYKFISTMESIRGECSMFPISFKNRFVKRHVGKHVLNEWMFPCNPSYRNGKKLIQEKFYVSRAYADDKVFLFRRFRRGKMRLMHYFYNTGIIDAELVDPHHGENGDGYQVQ